MTINDVITYVDQVVPNQYSTKQKIDWLAELDELVHFETILRHENENQEFVQPTGLDDKLLIEEPYAKQIYPHYVEAKIHYYNAEYGKFNNAMVMYNNNYARYTAMYEQDHKPIPQDYRYRF